jgi:tRNA dimethylallyltransferase
MSSFDDALVLTGPTGCGKTAWAVRLAPELGAEIVAMDSMTLYRGMDIGTAKPTAAEQAAVPHHGIDVLDPWESASVAQWLREAETACDAIRARGKRPLFVGGTPFYLMALCHGLFDAPPSDTAIRNRLEAEIARVGNEAAHARLSAADPVAAKRIHVNDTRRVVRALEVLESTGRPISSFQTTWDTPGFEPTESATGPRLHMARLDWPRDALYDRIDLRVGEMFAAGWVAECERLLALGRPPSREAGAALGYRDIFAALADGTCDVKTLTPVIRQKTRQFAKRQLTWFRRMTDVRVVPAHVGDLRASLLAAWET